jgi:alpha-mannosidase
VRVVVEQRLKVGASEIVQRIELEAESRLVRIVNRVEWNESRKQLRVQAVPAIHAAAASYEIQFGTVRRPTHANTIWDAAQFEVPGQRFADLSQPDYGLGIVNDSKYGYFIRDGVMELTLLRSSNDPDPNADLGTHEFAYGYYPHALGWEASELLERAHEMNAPLVTRAVAALPSEPVSEFSVTGGIVKLETVKRAEDSAAVIIRLYETLGTDHAVVLETRRTIASIVEVDLFEDGTRTVRGVRTVSSARYASSVPLRFSPFQIRRFKVEFGAS